MIVGYGVCGKEADRYLEGTLKEFARLCDKTIIVLNNATDKERDLINKYGFQTVEDNREWGTSQHLIKGDLMKEVAKLNPTYCVCLDMDEVFDQKFTREDLIEQFKYGNALYFYIVNLWNDGWNRKWSFWNIRAWRWTGDIRFENKPLHCGLAPAWCYRLNNIHVPHFITHYGLMKKEDRMKKVERYKKYDPQAKYKDLSYYNALQEDKSDILDYKFIQDSIDKEIGERKQRQLDNPVQQMEYYYVKSPTGKIIDIPARDLQETLKRGFTLVEQTGGSIPKKDKYKIAYIGKFKKLWDEEYIAQSFEELGHEVVRIDETSDDITGQILESKPDFVLFAKLNTREALTIITNMKMHGIPTICWLFDLYFDYTRENQVGILPCFKAQVVITTDNGHHDRWLDKGINHFCVRQGIYKPECYTLKANKEYDLVFIGSDNPSNKERNEILNKLDKDFTLTWIGKKDTNEARSTKLNEIFAKSKVIVGDSVYSPHYWSNRIVETLGRGGFLIHREVEGLKEEYPYLVTYTDYEDLKSKISYYIEHDKEREEIIQKNFEWVRDNYTCDKKCSQVIKIYEENCIK